MINDKDTKQINDVATSEYKDSVESEVVGTGIVPRNKTTLQEGKTILAHSGAVSGDISTSSNITQEHGSVSVLSDELFDVVRKKRLASLIEEDVSMLDAETLNDVVNSPVNETEVINDSFVDDSGHTIKAAELETLDDLQRVIDTQLTLPYFDNTPMDNAISIAQTVLAGAYEQYNLSEIVKELTGIRTYGTTDSMNTLSDYMYTATPEERAKVLNKTIKLFNEDRVSASQFVRMSLLTALGGQNMSLGGWDTAMYLLDALDLIPVASAATKSYKAVRTAANKGIKEAAIAAKNDVIGLFKYEGTGFKRNNIKKEKVDEATKEFRKMLDEMTREDVALSARKGSPIETVTESSVEKGNKIKAKLVTDPERPLKKPEVATRVGTTEESIKQQSMKFRIDGKDGMNNYMHIGADELLQRIKQESGATTPVLRNTFTDTEKSVALNTAYTAHKEAVADKELRIEQFIIVNKSGDVFNEVESAKLVNNKKFVPGSDEGFYIQSISGMRVAGKGTETTRPFKDIKEAEEALDMLRYDNPGIEASLVTRSPGTGEITTIPDEAIKYLKEGDPDPEILKDLENNIYIKTTTEYDYTIDDVMGYLTDIGRGYSNEVASVIWSDAAKKDWDLLDMTQRMLNLSNKFGKDLLDELHKGLSGISKKSLIAASKLADYGNRNMIEWTDAEVADIIKSSKKLRDKLSARDMAGVVKAYRALRDFADKLLEIENDAANRIITQHKIKAVTAPDGAVGSSVRAYVQVLDTSDRLKAYNQILSTADGGGNGVLWRFQQADIQGAADGIRVPVGSFEEFSELLDNPDITIVKSIDNTYGYGVTEEALAGRAKYNYTYLIVDKSTGYKVVDAPRNPIPRRPGWVPSRTLENVFVRVPLTVVVNDVVRQVTVTLGGYRNMAAAKKAIDKYKQAAKELLMKEKSGAKLTDAEKLKLKSLVFEKGHYGDIDKLIIKADKDMYAPESNLHRLVDDLRDGKLIGVPRKKQPLLYEEGREGIRLQNPIQAFEEAAMTVGRLHGGYDEHLALLRERFLKRYGEHLQHPNDYNSNWLDPSSEDALKGEEYRRNITRMHTIGERPDRLMQGWLWNIAAYIDEAGNGNKAVTKLAELGYDASRHFTPIVIAKSMVFVLALALNPLRQLLMQASGFSFIAAIDSVAASKAAVDALPLMAAALADKESMFYKSILKSVKLRGWDTEEFENLVKSYKDSGIPVGMDLNMMQVEQLYSASKAPVDTGNPLADTAVYIARAAKVIPKIATAIGFNAGEAYNLAATFAFQYHRMKKDGVNFKGKLAKDNYKTLSTSTMALALSPNKNGAYSLQRDWAAFATQFMAFQFKAMEFLLHGSKHKALKIDNKAKARLVFAQMVLWGTEGLGLAWVWDNYIAPKYREKYKEEPDEKLELFIKGGVTDLAINAMANAVSEDDELLGRSNRIRASESFSPFPKIAQGISDIIQYGFDDPGVYETLIGPVTALPGALSRAITDIYNVFVTEDVYNSPSERAVAVMSAIARIAPLYRNSENSFLAGVLADGYQNLIFSHKTGEAIVQVTKPEQLVFGLFGIKNDSQLDLWRSQKLKSSNIKKATAVADAAALLANREILRNGKVTVQSFTNAVRLAKPLLEVLKDNPDVYKKAVARFRKKLLTSTSTEEAMHAELAKAILNNSKPLDAYAHYISNYGSGLSKEEKAKLLKQAQRAQEFVDSFDDE